MCRPPERQYLEQVFINNRLSLQSYLRRCLSSNDDAADLLQECYLRLIRTTKPLSTQDIARAWLFTIARNLVVDLFRRRSVRGYDSQVNVEEAEIQDCNPNPQEALEMAQTLAQIKTCIKKMPDTTRKVFVLSRFEELTYTEIAQRLSLSTRTVERKMSEAMSLMNKHLDDHRVRNRQ